MITKSSFVGNNQIVKNNLSLSKKYTFCKDGSNYISTTLYVTTGKLYAGGNVALIYNNYTQSYPTEPIINISYSLFALGVDGSLGLSVNQQLSSNYDSVGTGLGILFLQTLYKVRVAITNTVAYRNQASQGGNLNFHGDPMSAEIILSSVSSMEGISLDGSTLYFSISPSSNTNLDNSTVQLKVINSNMVSNFTAAWGISIFTHRCRTPIQFEQSILATSLFVTDACVTNDPIIFNNTVFCASGCNGGMQGVGTNIVMSNCSFSKFTYLYGDLSDIYIADSTFSDTEYGGAISLDHGNLLLTGNVNFTNNKAPSGSGGALVLSFSNITFKAPGYIYFINNSASLVGGAILIRRDVEKQCNIFFDDSDGNLTNPGVHLYFENNIANESGDILYGGNIDECLYNCSLSPKYCSLQQDSLMLAILNATMSCANSGQCQNNFPTNPSMISSDSKSVCSCNNYSINCNSQNHTTIHVYPGQTIPIPIVTVGQLNGTSPDTTLTYTCQAIDENIFYNCAFLSFSLNNQHATRKDCSYHNYQVTGINDQYMNLLVNIVSKNAAFSTSCSNPYSVLLRMSPCPATLGFIWNDTTHMCDCHHLNKYGVQCDTNALTVSKSGILWIGKRSDGILTVHTHCPYNYCDKNNKTFSLENQDEQCEPTHGGVLCGGCKANLSAVFGSTQCKLCTNHYIWLLIPILLMGVVLMILIFLLNCTVSVGTINGVILYANIVRPGIINLLPTSNQNGFEKFLFVFIDWLNLDLGIETCFYDGMDTYAKTWLQFLFPLYILTLVGAIIIGSRWSSKLAWLSKHNAVPVLATLILLSYTKIFQTTITIFSFTKLDTTGSSNSCTINSSEHNPPVWLPDGNILYVQGIHAYLFVAGLAVAAAFIIPYTSLLFLSPWLQAKSHIKCFHWVNKLKPFIDAYQAPFKDQYRYWPGVQLMIRVVLYLVFTTNQANDINVNLLACAVLGCFYCAIINIFSVYKNWLLNILETLYLIELVYLSVSFLYINNPTNSKSNILVSISTGSVFIVFVAIVVFHLYLLVKGKFKRISPPMKAEILQSYPNVRALSEIEISSFENRSMDNLK